MSNVISFLEALARETNPVDLPLRLAGAQLAPNVQASILSRDPVALAQALGHGTYACMIATPEQDEPSPEEAPAEGDEENDPDQRAA